LPLAALAAAACAGEALDGDSLAERDLAHTSADPGAIVWAEMQGGSASQAWTVADAHHASRLTWVAGADGNLIRVMAYDPFGSPRDIEVYGGLGVDRLTHLAAHADDSRTMARVGDRPHGLGCAPAALEGFVVELVRVELGGACRWSHTLAVEGSDAGDSPAIVGVEAGPDGSVVVAGTTFRRFDFAGVMLGEDTFPVPDSATPSGFVVRLDAGGQVEWARDLGRVRLRHLAVGREGTAYVSGLPEGSEVWQYHQLDPEGGNGWVRALDVDVIPQALAASPTGDLAIAGVYSRAFSLEEGESFPDPEASPDVFLLRLDRLTAEAEGGRRQSVIGGVDITGASIDNHGRVAVVGNLFGSMVLGGRNLSAGATPRAWVALFSPAFGSVHWSRDYGGDAPDEQVRFSDVAVTSNSRVMTAGHFHGSIHFDGRARTGDRAAILLRHLP
jgi:hypothetical protein